MDERDRIGKQVEEFCEGLWKGGDPWDFEQSPYEKARCEKLIAMLSDRRYSRVFEIACGAGYFTRLLARLSDSVLAMDISSSAIERARSVMPDASIDFRTANVMDYQWQAEGSWDLIVFNDGIYYLGWLYPFFDVSWLASQLVAATRPGGRMLMANTMYEGNDKLLLPYMIRTYRDLMLNAGYRLEKEHVFQGIKNGVEFEVLMSLFNRPPE